MISGREKRKPDEFLAVLVGKLAFADFDHARIIAEMKRKGRHAALAAPVFLIELLIFERLRQRLRVFAATFENAQITGFYVLRKRVNFHRAFNCGQGFVVAGAL